MKLPDWCVFCKQPLKKSKQFLTIVHDDSYVMWCDNCPTKLAKWNGDSTFDSTIYSYEISYSTKDCKPEELYSIIFHIDDIIIELYPSDKRPYGDAFRLFKVNYEPHYDSKFIFGTSSFPEIDFENLTIEYLKNKVTKYITFI